MVGKTVSHSSYLVVSSGVDESEISKGLEYLPSDSLNICSRVRDNYSIIAISRFSATSKAPILIISQNGREFKCTKNRSSGELMWIRCSKRSKKYKCPFAMKVKMAITQDPENFEFWQVENWEIIECRRAHSCDQPHYTQPSYNGVTSKSLF